MKKEKNSVKELESNQYNCPCCGLTYFGKSNFCTACGKKLDEICNCWIKKASYNCGQSKCPGYGLFGLEKQTSF